MTKLIDRKDADRKFTWDLSSLYKSDRDWEQAFTELDQKTSAVMAFQGRLKDAPTIKGYYDSMTDLSLLLDDLFCYASLRKNEDNGADKGQRMYQRIYSEYTHILSATAFAEPEILSLDQDTLNKIKESDELKDYRYTLTLLIRRKAHTLSADQEKLLASFTAALGAPKDIANTLQDVDLTFDPVTDKNGQPIEVTGASYILLQSSDDRILRKNSFDSFYKGYEKHINTFAAAYQGAVRSACARAAARGYASSRAMSMAEECIPEDVYDNLTAAVRDHLPAMYDYAALRKRILGLDELHYYDLYAPLVKGSEKSYSLDQAEEMVLEALSPLGKSYTDTVRKAFKERWMDAYPNKGKTSGAYSSGTYRSNPYILLNFTGTLDSVSTIAHEMGHSMQTYLSNHKQPPQYADYTLFVAEVASTVNENLLVSHLLKTTDDPREKLCYLNQYLEGFKGTVYRQTMFAEFEDKAHKLSEKGEALNASTLNDIYEKLIKDYFGDNLTYDSQVRLEWARIPHFYRPFYVYKYATSYCAAVAISESILDNKEGALEHYLEFLSMGGSADPIDELRHAGVDLTRRDPIDAALDRFKDYVDQASSLI
ncbi:MAG: oligoendopeptidase F [Lachnospiraceae bacterium]|nr:oligoendopeptidase F [Lachnospiraceae bacterium]